MFEIEKNIPVGRARPSKYKDAAAVIAKMDVGDSFVFPSPSVPSALYAEAKNIGRNVAMRKIGDGQYRVFRTE